MLNLPSKTIEEGVKSLIKAIKDLLNRLNMSSSVAECNIDKELYMNKIEVLAERAFEDQCTTANPRMPLVRELEEIYRRAYGADK